MANHESYVTKSKPSLDDWLEYNSGVFAVLQDNSSEKPVQWAPLVDADRHASEAGTTVDEYFKQIQDLVGDLGDHALKLVYTEMDAASHITIARKDCESDF